MAKTLFSKIHTSKRTARRTTRHVIKNALRQRTTR